MGSLCLLSGVEENRGLASNGMVSMGREYVVHCKPSRGNEALNSETLLSPPKSGTGELDMHI